MAIHRLPSGSDRKSNAATAGNPVFGFHVRTVPSRRITAMPLLVPIHSSPMPLSWNTYTLPSGSASPAA